MQIDFAVGAKGRADYGLPNARMVNMMVEATPAGPAKSARLPRPGLSELYQVGTGPVVGMFQGSGVFGGDGFVVSGAQMYQGTTLIGVVNRARIARMSSSESQLVVVTDGVAYSYDGALLSAVTDGDLPPVSDVAYLGGRFYYVQKDTGVLWRSDIGDATSIDGLAFMTAESAPDPLVGILVLYDELWGFGSETVEPFSQSGDADNPLQRSLGRRFNRGCAAQATIVPLDNTAFWLGDNRRVYRASDRPIRVSDDHIDGLLKACDDIGGCSALPVSFEGHDIYVLNIPGQGSWGYDIATKTWGEWASFGLDNFRCSHGLIADGLPYLGDALTGKIWALDPEAFTDGGEPIEVVATCGVTVDAGKAPRCDNLLLEGAMGVGPEDGSDALVEMRHSDTKGKLWTPWASRTLGRIGEYAESAFWTRLGSFKRQRVFEFRSTAAVLRTFIAVHMNIERV